jgi:hypothetical protein
MSPLERRVARLEQRNAPDPDDPFGLGTLSLDELNILAIDLARARLADPTMPDQERARAAEEIERVERAIRGRAAAYINPDYSAHWNWVREQWGRLHGGPFLPPLTVDGPWWNYDATKAVEEMRWRGEIRARPDIAALIAEGEAMAANRGELQ